jgi:hypothetical protein
LEIKRDSSGEVGQSLVIALQIEVGITTIVIGCGILGIKLDGLSEGGQGLIVVLQIGVSNAAIGIGKGNPEDSAR